MPHADPQKQQLIKNVRGVFHSDPKNKSSAGLCWARCPGQTAGLAVQPILTRGRRKTGRGKGRSGEGRSHLVSAQDFGASGTSGADVLPFPDRCPLTPLCWARAPALSQQTPHCPPLWTLEWSQDCLLSHPKPPLILTPVDL